MPNGKGIKIDFDVPCPCEGCQNRYIGCHTICEQYKKYNIIRKTVSAIRFKKRQNSYSLNVRPTLDPMRKSKSARERYK